MSQSLFEKVWDAHAVRQLSNGQTQLLIGTHLIHEVTSPQAFGMLRDLGLEVKFPNRTFATVDHIVKCRTTDVVPPGPALDRHCLRSLSKIKFITTPALMMIMRCQTGFAG